MTAPPKLPKPIALAQAQARLLDGIVPLGGETLPAQQANGRYLAEPIVAQRTQPSADLSAMDGYAVRTDDLSGPWKVVGESAAGHPFNGQLEAGQVARISTGALMPTDSGAVLLQENAERDGDTLTLTSADGPTPRHIRRTGMDFRTGEVLQNAGALVNPARIALSLSAGHAQLLVGKRPRVAIIDSGDELAGDPANVALHQIPASNGIMLTAMAAPLASTVDRIGPVPDRMDDLLAAFDKAASADVIVTSGGASVGDHDLVRPALEQWGATIDFWRIAMKPGKPLMVARRGEQVILGLPGNPVSSYVTAFLFLLPVLRKLAGASSPLPQPIALRSGAALPPTGKRAEFVRAQIEDQFITPLSQQDSSALAGLSRSDALIYREADKPAAVKGDVVTAYQLQNGGNA